MVEAGPAAPAKQAANREVPVMAARQGLAEEEELRAGLRPIRREEWLGYRNDGPEQ